MILGWRAFAIAFLYLIVAETASQAPDFSLNPDYSNLNNCDKTCLANLAFNIGCETNACICSPVASAAALQTIASCHNQGCVLSLPVAPATSIFTSYCGSFLAAAGSSTAGSSGQQCQGPTATFTVFTEASSPYFDYAELYIVR
jgi:hypothetical protein